MSYYKSEVYVPIKKDDHLFEDRQKGIWEDVHDRMERRRREWEGEVERMRHDFFRLKPSTERKGSSENLLETMDLDRIFHDDGTAGEGNKRFQVSFDVSQFSPEEISVRTQESKVIVHAKHEETGKGKNVSREFSRQVDIPRHVDSEALTCTLSKDGILSIEAPVPAPQYDRICNTRPTGSNKQPVLASQMLGQGTSHMEPYPAVNAQSLMTEADALSKRKFVVELGTEFCPEDIVVKTIDRKLQVTARHEERSGGRTSMREFSKEFELPDDVDPNAVVASMTDDGQLILEAPILANCEASSKNPQVTISLR